MRPNKVTLFSSNFIFVRREYSNKAEGTHKLQPIAYIPLQIITADDTTVTVRSGDQVE